MGMLDGKVAVITGSGRGIGSGTAQLFAEEGASVVVNDLEEGTANEVVQAIEAAGGNAVSAVGSVTDPNIPGEIINKAISEFGKIDILVNNAGYTWDSMIHKMTDEQWYAMMDVHVTAAFRMIRAAAPYMRDAAKKEMSEGKRVVRKIVNVMSVAGTMGNMGQANYSAAKAAISGLTKTVAREWGAFNVNCNAVAFGFIETRMTREKAAGNNQDKTSLGIPKEQRDALLNMIALRRSASPREAGKGILFLSSPLSDYVTGHVLHVDGGMDM